MARQGLQGRSPKRSDACLTRPDKAAEPIPDLVRRDFTPSGSISAGAGTDEIPTDEGKLYLATVLDLASRRLPGFAMSAHHDSAVAKAALCMAAAVRGGDVDGVVFHSERAASTSATCSPEPARRSASRSRWAGSARHWTTLPAESFNSTLEHELLSRRRFATRDQARREVAWFIDAYNHRRRHSACDMLPPVAYEQILAQRAADAAGPDRAA